MRFTCSSIKYLMASIHSRLGQKDKALAGMLKMAELGPESLRPHFNLAAVYFNQGSIDQAIQLYHYVLERDPDDRSARENLEKVLQVKSVLKSAADSTSPAEIPPE